MITPGRRGGGTGRRGRVLATLVAGSLLATLMLPAGGAPVTAAPAVPAAIPAGSVVRITVEEAIGGKTVIGQLTVDRATQSGFVTAYACADGVPPAGRSDVNYDGRVMPWASNRLIVQADANGEVCFLATTAVDLVIDVNAVSFDVGINSFPNRRTDTRRGTTPHLAAGGTLRINVPEARGAKTVIGQLTVDRTSRWGFVTAYPCADGVPAAGRSDLNYDGRVTPVASNRLIVQADANGDICLDTTASADLVVDVNAVTDVGIDSFPNRRTDTRRGANPQLAAGGTLRVHVPEAVGGRTVVGQLTVDRTRQPGFVTAYACAVGLPAGGRSDVNYDGRVTPAASNRLIVQADANGDVCFDTTAAADLIVDVNAITDVGINSFANRRTDTRTGDGAGPVAPPGGGTTPTWPPFEPLPPLAGAAALTGQPVSAAVSARPIVAVKIDNYRAARPHFGLDRADAVFELSVEGVSRFVALYQTNLPDTVGPVRSARTADLDLLTAMNRPVFAYSGANPGVTDWVRSAERSGVLFDFSALRRPCYRRTPERVGPHNLLLDAACAVQTATTAGPARPLWAIDAGWTPAGVASSPDSTFAVPMPGVAVSWTWDAASRRYLRTQDGGPHLAASGAQIGATTVVEVRMQHIPSPVDARSAHAISVGSGDGVVHRNGRAIPVRWSRPTAYDPFTFTTPEGVAVPLDRGTTFVEITRP